MCRPYQQRCCQREPQYQSTGVTSVTCCVVRDGVAEAPQIDKQAVVIAARSSSRMRILSLVLHISWNWRPVTPCRMK